jgi:hypothetical protein
VNSAASLGAAAPVGSIFNEDLKIQAINSDVLAL